VTQITCLIPCLNEEKTIGGCIDEAKKVLNLCSLDGEILVADNGSSDDSIQIAKKAGARVVHVNEKGYGSALRGGISAADSEFIVMADADQTYEWTDLKKFFDLLNQDFDLVMGNRFSGKIEKGAMPFLNKYIGNPLLSFIGKLFFKSKIGDFHCGLRGFKKSSILNLNLTSTGMEFASEIVIKASLAKLKITEIPTKLRIPPYERKPHLRPFRDGWRHLRLMLSYAPKFSIGIPSLLALFFGLFVLFLIYFFQGDIFNIQLREHSLLVSTVFTFIGVQGLFAWLVAEYSLYNNKIKKFSGKFFPYLQKAKTLEFFSLLGIALFGLGLFFSFSALSYWQSLNYGDLQTFELLTSLGPGFLFMIFGLQFILSSFLLESIKSSNK
jgi:glycosyltransferase involved in cell wall biosynthesis